MAATPEARAASGGSADSAPPPAVFAGPRGAGALLNTVAGIITQAATSLFTAGLTLYLVRALGRSGYGIFALTLTIGTFALLLCDAGVSVSASRYIAERFGERREAANVAAAALRLNLLAGAACAAALWLLAAPLARAFSQPHLLWPLRGMALAVFGQSMLVLYLRVYSALRRVALGVRVVFLESLAETSCSVALVATGFGAAGAAFGRAGGYAVGGLASLWVARRVLGPGAMRLRPRGDGQVRRLARYALPLLVTNGAYTLYATIDGILIGAMLSTGQVGLFSAPMRFIVFLGYVGQSVGGAVGPRVAATAHRASEARTWAEALRWLIMFQALLIAPLLVWARPIVALGLGSGFSGAAGVLRIFSLYAFLAGISPMISLTVNFLGEASRRVPVVLGSLTVNVVLDVVLLPRIGVIGAAIGTTVAYGIYVPAHFQICRRVLNPPLRRLLRTTLSSALAAGAMALVLWSLGTRNLSAAAWFAGAAGGSTAYLAVLVLLRELTAADARRAVRSIRGRLAPG